MLMNLKQRKNKINRNEKLTATFIPSRTTRFHHILVICTVDIQSVLKKTQEASNNCFGDQFPRFIFTHFQRLLRSSIQGVIEDSSHRNGNISSGFCASMEN